MPTKAKKNKNAKKNAKKTAKPQNKKATIKTKKVGKTVTFQAKPKTDPFGKRTLPAIKSDGTPAGKTVCSCGNMNCCNSRPQPQSQSQRNPNDIPPFIRQIAEQLGNDMGAQSVVVVGFPLNPANPRTEPPTKEEMLNIFRAAGMQV